MVSVRFFKTDHYSFVFLFWNLFLAWVPVFLIKRINPGDPLYRKYILCGLSILFLPNAPYILTDLFHLKKNLVAPLWFDLILILSFALTGMIYFIFATDLILKQINSLIPKVRKLAALLLFFATGYGIYLGRYLRFNSWNIVSDPVTLAGGIYTSLLNSDHYKETISVTVTFTVFLYLVYEIYLSFKSKSVSDNT